MFPKTNSGLLAACGILSILDIRNFKGHAIYVSNALADNVICSGTSGRKSASKSFFSSDSNSESPIV